PPKTHPTTRASSPPGSSSPAPTTSPRPAVACTSPTHAHGLIVLTLAGDKICAITRFGDNSLLPTPRDHRISRSDTPWTATAPDGRTLTLPSHATTPTRSCLPRSAPRRSGLTSPDPVTAPVSWLRGCRCDRTLPRELSTPFPGRFAAAFRTARTGTTRPAFQ